jgi:hypothetical protein
VLSLLFATAALAGDWHSQPIEPRYEYDFTAYTVPRGRLRVGLLNLDYGLMKNVQVGLAPLPFFALVANAHVKVTAIQTPHFDASIAAGVLRYGTSNFHVTSTPVDLTGSWLVSKRFSFHGGVGFDHFAVGGQVSIRELGDALGTALGADPTDELEGALEGMGNLYAGASAALYELHLAGDWRFNRRDSLVFQYRHYYLVRGGLEAGYEDKDDHVSVGTVVHLSYPLALGTGTVSWQFTWPHWRLRMGLGLSNAIPIVPSLIQAWDVAYVF